jgi:hypothetical protein
MKMRVLFSMTATALVAVGSASLLGNGYVGDMVPRGEAQNVVGACAHTAAQTFEICDSDSCGKKAVGSYAPTEPGQGFTLKKVDAPCSDSTCSEEIDAEDGDCVKSK